MSYLCGKQGSTCSPEGLQSESEETRVERDARWRIRVVEQQRNRRGACHDWRARHGREKQCLFGGLVLKQFNLGRDRHVGGAKMLAAGWNGVVRIVVMGRTAFSVMCGGKLANQFTCIDHASEKGEQPAAQCNQGH